MSASHLRPSQSENGTLEAINEKACTVIASIQTDSTEEGIEGLRMPTPERCLLNLLDGVLALYADEFESDKPISGADFLEEFSLWRRNAWEVIGQ